MDSKFQSSFIPKTPMVGQQTYQREKTSPMGKLAAAIFVISILGIGGLFAYKKISEGEVTGLKEELALAENSVDKAGIKALSDFDKKLKAAKEIVANHVSVSEYLSFLEKNTLTSAAYSSLSYTAPDARTPITVSLLGTAPSYAAIAQAEKLLLSNPAVLSAKFGSFKLGNSGKISFTLAAEIKSDIVKWSNTVKPAVTAPATTAPKSSSTSTSTSTTTDMTEDLDAGDIDSLDMPDLPNF